MVVVHPPSAVLSDVVREGPDALLVRNLVRYDVVEVVANFKGQAFVSPQRRPVRLLGKEGDAWCPRAVVRIPEAELMTRHATALVAESPDNDSGVCDVAFVVLRS